MTLADARPDLAPAAPDPFALPPAAPPSTRLRALSYVGRWGRARRWLPADALRVLDIGCSFGYGAAAIRGGGSTDRVVVGVERDPENLALARQRFPWITVLDGDATAVPVADAVADAVTMLDIVEHVDRPEAAIAEAHRVLRPSGTLVVSVPHRGLLHRLDALNLYEALRRKRPHWRALTPSTQSGGHEHRHFTVRQLEDLMAPWFVVDRVARTGLGLQELVALFLIAFSVPLRAQRLAHALAITHVVVYAADDLLPLGRLGYHLTVRARPLPQDGRP